MKFDERISELIAELRANPEASKRKAIIAEARERLQALEYTTGHCANKAQPGGCQLHNLHCGYPDCDRRPAIGESVCSGHCPDANTNGTDPANGRSCRRTWGSRDR